MITEKDLQEAIAECQGQRNPNANTCIMLAAFLTIQREMFGSKDEIIIPTPTYSNALPNYVSYESDTEFSKLTNGMDANDLIPIFDELMTTLYIVNPNLYNGVIRRISE